MTTGRMTWGRVLRIAFVVAACLSFLVNAAVIGVGLRLAGNGMIGGGIGMMMTELPHEKRQEYRAALRAERPQLQALAQDLRARRKTMLTIAGTEPVDAAALAQAMADVREATATLQNAAHEAILRSAHEDSRE